MTRTVFDRHLTVASNIRAEGFDLGGLHGAIADLLMRKGEFNLAHKHYQHQLGSYKIAFGDCSQKLLSVYAKLYSAALASSNFVEAKVIAVEACRFLPGLEIVEPAEAIRKCFVLCRLFRHGANFPAAQICIEQAVVLLRKNPNSVSIMENAMFRKYLTSCLP